MDDPTKTWFALAEDATSLQPRLDAILDIKNKCILVYGLCKKVYKVW